LVVPSGIASPERDDRNQADAAVSGDFDKTPASDDRREPIAPDG
jgi:hypothetical protein